MTPEKVIDPSRIATLEVTIWTRSRAEEAGFENFLPEGKPRIVVILPRDKDGNILEARIMEGIDVLDFAMKDTYKKEKTNEARKIYGLAPIQ